MEAMTTSLLGAAPDGSDLAVWTGAIAAVMAVGGLLVAWSTHRRTAPNIEVELSRVYGMDALQINVRNRSAAPVQLTDVTFVVKDGSIASRVFEAHGERGPDLPHALDGFQQAVWERTVRDVFGSEYRLASRNSRTRKQSVRVRGEVSLGQGKVRSSKWTYLEKAL
jgi:hypothetical protein